MSLPKRVQRAALLALAIGSLGQIWNASERQRSKDQATSPLQTTVSVTPILGIPQAHPPRTANALTKTILEDTEPERVLLASREMAERGPGTHADLILALPQATTPLAAGALADSLASIGSMEAVQALLTAALQAEDEDIRQAFAEGLRSLSNPEGVEALTSALASTDDSLLLKEITECLGRLANQQTVEFLAELYREPANTLIQRESVIRVLRSIESEEASQALIHLMANAEEPDLSRAAAISLSAMDTSYARNALRDFLHDLPPDDPVRLSFPQDHSAEKIR